jgi:NAD(P)-dependent dehydrogenase (short-subunit alcohol dehydrogenase family)
MGRRAISLQADLAIESQAALLFEVALREFESIDCLINCASVFVPDTPLTAEHDTWEQNITINLRAPLILSQAFAGQKEGTQTRVIINITDALACGANISHSTYALSKAGLQHLTRMFAKVLAPKVRVNDIALGLVIPCVSMPYVHFEELCLKTPLSIPTSMDEVNQAVSFILKAQSMTGATVTLDSGMGL